MRVEDAHGQPPSIPFWLGEAPARSHELSLSVSRLREEIGSTDPPAAVEWLTNESIAQSGASKSGVSVVSRPSLCLAGESVLEKFLRQR